MAFGIPVADTQPSHRGEGADHINFSRIPRDFILLSLSITTVDRHNVVVASKYAWRGRLGEAPSR